MFGKVYGARAAAAAIVLDKGSIALNVGSVTIIRVQRVRAFAGAIRARARTPASPDVIFDERA
jgi:hypothetical protein